MLILTRKLGESIIIGDQIQITLLDIKGKHVRIGVKAPKGVSVHRGEVYEMIQEENIKALESDVIDSKMLSTLWAQVKKEILEENDEGDP